MVLAAGALPCDSVSGSISSELHGGCRALGGLSYSFTTCSALSSTSSRFSPLPWLSVLRPGLGLTSLWSSLAWYTVGSWHSCADGFSPCGAQKGFFIPRRGCLAGSAPRHSQLSLETPGPEELGRRPLEPLVVRRRGVLCCGVWKVPGASLLLSSAGLRASQAVTLPRPASSQQWG